MASARSKTQKAKSPDVGYIASVTAEDIASWQSACDADPVTTPDKVPAGWYTLAQLQHGPFGGVSLATASRIVKSLTAKGKVERGSYKIQAGSRVMPVPHYKLV